MGIKPAVGRGVTVIDEESYQLLIVNYSGEVMDGELLEGFDCSYNKLYRVKKWDLLLSNMGFGRGAISIVPPYYEGKFVSSEYTILRAASNDEAVFYCNLLRTKEILGDILSATTGMNRGRIKWDVIKKVQVPKYEPNEQIGQLAKEIEDFWKASDKFYKSRSVHINKVADDLDVNGDDANYRWLSFKPPE